MDIIRQPYSYKIIYPHHTGHTALAFNIHLNSEFLSIPTPPGLGIGANTIRSVMAHELGHALGLWDNTNSNQQNFLMSHSRNRETVVGPTAAEQSIVRVDWCK